MTSPEDDTNTDSVLDMATEHRDAIGSRGSIRFGRRRAPDVPEAGICFLDRAVAGLVGGLGGGAGATFGNGIGFSKPSRPLVGGADSALIRRAGLISPSLAKALVTSSTVLVAMFHTRFDQYGVKRNQRISLEIPTRDVEEIYTTNSLVDCHCCPQRLPSTACL